MLGQYNLLPLLKGWEYKTHIIERTNLVKGAEPVEKGIDERGWLHYVDVIATDCYARLSMEWQGADLQTHTASANIEQVRAYGAFQQDPSGYIARYFRPNPFSTAGAYVATFFGGGHQGSVWPYIPTVKVKISLDSESTQETANVSGAALVIAITDPKLFMASLRALLSIEGKLDPKWFSLGPGFEVKSP